MSDQELLAGYINVWSSVVDDFVALLEEVPIEAWDTPTDLAGWDVRACAAHIAHLERVLAGYGEEHADLPDAPHVKGLLGHYTEIGVVNRRENAPDQIIAEIREVTAARREQLAANPPTDGDAQPEVSFAGVTWPWRTLLRNRPLDVWMHEQDVRRAVGLPGGMDSAGAQHTADYLMESFGFVLAKKVGAPAGTTAVLEVEGSAPVAFTVNDAGRGAALAELPTQPMVRLSTDRESFVVLAGGRRQPAAGAVRVEGDAALGAQILASMATTP